METLLLVGAAVGIVWISTMALTATQSGLREIWVGRRQRQDQARHQGVAVREKTTSLYVHDHHQKIPAAPWRTLEVVDIVQESVDCRSFILADPSGDLLPGFLPGQHLLVEHASVDYPAIRRCYSLSLASGVGKYRITVKRESQGTPATSMSQRLHDVMRKGGILRCKGPQGRFFVGLAGNEPIVLMAAGIGVTPMVAMASSLLQQDDTRPIDVVYQVRDFEHAPLLTELWDLQKHHKNLHLHVFMSQPPQWKPQPGFHQGKIDVPSMKAILEGATPHFFLCGPDAWMETQRGILAQLNHSADRIHWESFGSTVDKSPNPTLSPAKTSQTVYSVRFHQNQTPISCSDDTTLLEVLENHDVMIDAGCRSGNCGSCIAKLKSGTVRYGHPPGCSLQSDEIALCVAIPTSEVELELP